MADVVAETRTVRAAPARREAEGRAPAPARPQVEPPPVRRSRKLLRYGLFVFGAAVLIIGGLRYYLSGGRYVSTDDSYLQANVLAVSTDVSGIVDQIPVHEGEHVTAGQVLYPARS